MGRCMVCERESDHISRALGLCAGCMIEGGSQIDEQIAAAHAQARKPFGLPAVPPRATDGTQCQRCVNSCRIGVGNVGYCGVRHNDGDGLRGGDADRGAVGWYHDPLPTNCVAVWVCPASGAAGYPRFTDTKGPEYGYTNLAVFYEACTFDCLFCQNWYFREHSISGPRHTADELADAVRSSTRCICFFGGDPSCQVQHALAAARKARRARADPHLRICWETNGSVARSSLDEMAEVSLESGGCIKFDLKAWDEKLHRALCGCGNRRTLRNFEHLAGMIGRRPDPPFLVAATLMVPGYVEADQVARLAEFIAALDPNIPYALLAFHPAFRMKDLPITPCRQAMECLAAAEQAGLKRVRIGNLHLLS
jgi:pyruvate formate lyase activating enzyme